MRVCFFYLVKITCRLFSKIAKSTSMKFLNSLSNILMKSFLNISYTHNIKVAQSFNKVRYDNKIWVCWFQGIENAPTIVLASIKSIEKNKPNNFEVIILTDSNYKEYVDLPDYILKKYDLGLITKAQFSDILRVNLLYHHGGFWIDSTVYMMKRIDSKIIESNDFITLCDDKDNNSIGISQGRWTGYFMYSKRDSQEFEFLVCLFNNYWKSEDKLINYFLIDYAISLTYDKFPEFRRKVHMGGLDGANKFLMDKLLQSRDVSALQINSLINDRTGIFKLSHKNFYNKNKVYVDLIEEIDCVNNQNSCDL